MAAGPEGPSDLPQLLALLGPLVPAVLRQADGSLDLSKLPTQSIGEFREFLLTQVKADGIAFNQYLFDSYHKVFAKEEYQPLWQGLFEVARGGGGGVLAHPDLIQKFTAEIIQVSAQKFVSSQIQNDVGRQRIHSILLDKKHFTKEIRADVAKAVAQVGYEMGSSTKNFVEFNRQISVMNYGNFRVNEKKMAEAGRLAGVVLEEVGRLQNGATALEGKYLESPQKVERFVGLDGELGRKITDEEIRDKAKFFQDKQGKSDSVSQLQAKLAHLWLMVVDDGNWQQTNSFKTGENGAFLIRQTEDLLKQGETISDEFQFVKWSESIRNFLNGGLGVTGKGVGRKLEDFFSTAMVSAMMSPIPQAHRGAYDDLKQQVDEILSAADMGETVFRGPDTSAGSSVSDLQEIKSRFVSSLQQMKLSLWYGYKQHKLLSRGISWAASLAHTGDVDEIQSGQRTLDQLIHQVEVAKDPAQIAAAVQTLQDHLKENGKLQEAIRASEMEGVEQFLGLGQTILILMATRGLYRWALPARAAQAAGEVAAAESSAVSSATLGQKVVQGIKAYPLLATKSFGLGVYISTAENALAAASGEVRPQGDNFFNWFKDSLATGASMALFAPFSAGYGFQAAEEGLGAQTMARYSTGLWKPIHWVKAARSLAHVGADAFFETAEELSDAYMRAKLDDGNAQIGFDQAREIALASSVGGGFAKMGTIGEMLRGTKKTEGSPKKGGNGQNGRGSVEGSESLVPPSLFPKKSGIFPIDLGFLKSVMTFPSAWSQENRNLLAQVLLVSMVGAGIPPGPSGKQGRKSILEKILKEKLSDYKKLSLFQGYEKKLRSAKEGTPIVYQALTDMPQLFDHKELGVRRGAMVCFLAAVGKLPTGDSQVDVLLGRMEEWQKKNQFPEELHEPLDSQIRQAQAKLPLGHPRWQALLGEEIQNLKEDWHEPKRFAERLSNLQKGIKHLFDRKDLLVQLYYLLEQGINEGHPTPALHLEGQILQSLVIHALHSDLTAADAPEELHDKGPFVQALKRLYEFYQNPSFEPEVLKGELGEIVPSLTEKQWATLYGSLTPELVESLEAHREAPVLKDPTESLRPKALSQQAKVDFKFLRMLENLGVGGNYDAADALFELAKLEEGGNDVYALQSLIKIGRAGRDFAWEMLASLAETSRQVVIELQHEASETRDAKALGALRVAGEKNPLAKEAAAVLLRRKRFSRETDKGSTILNSISSGLGNFFQQEQGPDTSNTATHEGIFHLTQGQMIGVVLVLTGAYLAWTIYQGRKRRFLVQRAIDGDRGAYQEIFQNAKRGDRKSISAMADMAERLPQAVLDLDGLRSKSKYSSEISTYLQTLDISELAHLASQRNNPLALQALLVLAGEKNFHSEKKLQQMNLDQFLDEPGFHSVRAYLLAKIATEFNNPSAESTLLQAYGTLKWDALDIDANLWPVIKFFATKGFSPEMKLTQTWNFKELFSKIPVQKDCLGLLKEVIIPAALMGNESAQSLLEELNPKELGLSSTLNFEEAWTLGVMAEWGNPIAWAVLENRASKESLPILMLINLSRYGHAPADPILKNLDVKAIFDQLPDENNLGGYVESDPISALVELDIWGHEAVRKRLPALVRSSQLLEEAVRNARQGNRAYYNLDTRSDQLDETFRRFISNYNQLPGLRRQQLQQRVLQAWLGLPATERMEAYEDHKRTVGEFTPIPIPFVLQKAQEFGFRSLGLKDLQTRQWEKTKLGRDLGCIAGLGLLLSYSATDSWAGAANHVMAASPHAHPSLFWGLSVAALGGFATIINFSRKLQEAPPLYLAQQARILSAYKKLSKKINPRHTKRRAEAEGMLAQISRLPMFQIPPNVIMRLLDKFKEMVKAERRLEPVKEEFQDRQESYIQELLSRHDLVGDESEQVTQVLLGVLDLIDDRAVQSSLTQLAHWYEKVIEILQRGIRVDPSDKVLSDLIELGRNLDHLTAPGSTDYGHPGWFMEPDELTRAYDRLLDNAKNKSYHFHKDFEDLDYLLWKLEEDTQMDPLLRASGRILQGRLFEEADSTFLAAIEESLEWRQKKNMEKQSFIGFLHRVFRAHPNEGVRLQAKAILEKFGYNP